MEADRHFISKPINMIYGAGGGLWDLAINTERGRAGLLLLKGDVIGPVVDSAALPWSQHAFVNAPLCVEGLTPFRQVGSEVQIPA